jgi:hypothetical protein
VAVLLSSKPFSNLKLEARAYDKNQVNISRVIASVPNLLSYDLLKEKNFEEIKNLQNIQSSNTNIIAQRTIQSFAVAIDFSDFKGELKPKFYGVRIYSVQRN